MLYLLSMCTIRKLIHAFIIRMANHRCYYILYLNAMTLAVGPSMQNIAILVFIARKLHPAQFQKQCKVSNLEYKAWGNELPSNATNVKNKSTNDTYRTCNEIVKQVNA